MNAASTVSAAALSLADRPGARPMTSQGIPHRQIDQTPEPALYARLVERFLALPGTTAGDSLVSVPGARALFLPACGRCNTRFGFMRGREFAHVHPADDGSFHMVLAPDDVATVLLHGWGELHPLVPSGRILPTAVMVYAPRDDAEIDTVLTIVAASLSNARTPCGPVLGEQR
jgi:hypothetical protein